MTPDPREETERAIRFALDNGSDMNGVDPEEHLQENWETYIEEEVHLSMWEEDRLPDDPEQFIEQMKECADDVAEEFGVSVDRNP